MEACNEKGKNWTREFSNSTVRTFQDVYFQSDRKTKITRQKSNKSTLSATSSDRSSLSNSAARSFSTTSVTVTEAKNFLEENLGVREHRDFSQAHSSKSNFCPCLSQTDLDLREVQPWMTTKKFTSKYLIVYIFLSISTKKKLIKLPVSTWDPKAHFFWLF